MTDAVKINETIKSKLARVNKVKLEAMKDAIAQAFDAREEFELERNGAVKKDVTIARTKWCATDAVARALVLFGADANLMVNKSLQSDGNGNEKTRANAKGLAKVAAFANALQTDHMSENAVFFSFVNGVSKLAAAGGGQVSNNTQKMIISGQTLTGDTKKIFAKCGIDNIERKLSITTGKDTQSSQCRNLLVNLGVAEPYSLGRTDHERGLVIKDTDHWFFESVRAMFGLKREMIKASEQAQSGEAVTA